jgi:hypothetical protein
MKKIFTKIRYTRWKSNAALKALKAKSHRKSRRNIYRLIFKQYVNLQSQDPIQAPQDFRLIDEPGKCLEFFKKIRSKDSLYYHDGSYVLPLNLKNIQNIDYCSVSILKALMLNFKPQNIMVQGSTPQNSICLNYLVDSGFFDGLLDLNNNPIHLKAKSDRILFTKGAGSLSDSEDMYLINTLKKIRLYLTGEKGHCPQLRTIILEICGNSIEHSESYKNQWIFGVKYEDQKVIITLTDSGKGILGTLYRKLGKKFTDFVSKTKVEILAGAFDKKYESKTLDTNRNKGLPAVKHRFENGYIRSLIVITNNVILNFDDNSKSQVLKENIGFNGTIFKMELDKTCFKN